MVSNSNFNSVNSGSNFNSVGSYSSLSSLSNMAEQITKKQNSLKQIYSEIIINRETLYEIIGLKNFLFSQNMSTTFANDMGIIERQVKFIQNKIKNQLIRVQLQDQLYNHYDKIVQQRNSFEKIMIFLRRNNIVTPEIVKYVISIEKYFDIKTSANQQDEDEFDNLEIPSEIDL